MRPCRCDKVQFPLLPQRRKDDCFLCWVFYHPSGERHRELWQEWPDGRTTKMCEHLGVATGETVPCCNGRQTDLFRCARHTVCTLFQKSLNIPCCTGCLDHPSRRQK